jgi:hypothetical protein
MSDTMSDRHRQRRREGVCFGGNGIFLPWNVVVTGQKCTEAYKHLSRTDQVGPLENRFCSLIHRLKKYPCLSGGPVDSADNDTVG